MTIILSLLTNDYVMQLSDRRITTASGQRTVVTSDEVNKALMVDGRFLFSFTGLARIGRTPVIDWLRQRFALEPDRSISDRLRGIGEELTDRFKRLQLSESDKRLAIVGVGWANYDGILEPVYCSLSNFFADDQTYLDKALDSFSLFSQGIHPRHSALLIGAGVRFPRRQWSDFYRQARRAIRGGVGPDVIGYGLASWMKLAAQNEVTVSSHYLLTAINKTAAVNRVSSGMFSFSHKPPARSDTSASFFLFDERDVNYVARGPDMVNGSTQFSKFESRRFIEPMSG